MTTPDPLQDWLTRLAVLDEAERTWHQVTLPTDILPIKVQEILDNCNINRYIWNTEEFTVYNGWNKPLREFSKAKTIFFENADDILMFRLLL